MIRYIASIFVAFFFVACGDSNSSRLDSTQEAPTGKRLGAWLLDTSSYENNDTAQRNYIFANLANRSIKHIDQAVAFELQDDNSYKIAHEDNLIDFIATAIGEGIRVNLLINQQELFANNSYEEAMKKALVG